jgi:copper chaperone CopZ
LSAVPGVREPEIDFNSGIVSVVYDPTQAEVPRLVGVVRETGYDVTSFQKLGGG